MPSFCRLHQNQPDMPAEFLGVQFGNVTKLLLEFILPYDAVRTADGPDAALLEFLQSTYQAAADAGHWDHARFDSLEKADPYRQPNANAIGVARAAAGH
jgi:Family of unknown function (DUF5996)